MELQILVAHGSNGAFALEEPLEVGPNVRPSIPVAIQWKRRNMTVHSKKKIVPETLLVSGLVWLKLFVKKAVERTHQATLFATELLSLYIHRES